MTSYIYLVAHPSGWCKVGYAADVRRRFQQLTNVSESPLNGVAVFPSTQPKEDEKTALSALSAFRITGEWFDISPEAALPLLRKALGRTELAFPTEKLRSSSQIPPTQVRIEPNLKRRVQAAADRSGRSLTAEVVRALERAYPAVSETKEALRYLHVWVLRWVDMGAAEADRHPARPLVQKIHWVNMEEGERFTWSMVGGRPADLDEVLEEWEVTHGSK